MKHVNTGSRWFSFSILYWKPWYRRPDFPLLVTIFFSKPKFYFGMNNAYYKSYKYKCRIISVHKRSKLCKYIGKVVCANVTLKYRWIVRNRAISCLECAQTYCHRTSCSLSNYLTHWATRALILYDYLWLMNTSNIYIPNKTWKCHINVHPK